MSVHDSKDWQALEIANMVGEDRKLIVNGKVQVGAGNEKPLLTEAVPQGFNASILILELTTETDGDIGTAALTWKDAEFLKSIFERQYSRIEIRGHASVDVVEGHS